MMCCYLVLAKALEKWMGTFSEERKINKKKCMTNLLSRLHLTELSNK